MGTSRDAPQNAIRRFSSVKIEELGDKNQICAKFYVPKLPFSSFLQFDQQAIHSREKQRSDKWEARLGKNVHDKRPLRTSKSVAGSALAATMKTK